MKMSSSKIIPICCLIFLLFSFQIIFINPIRGPPVVVPKQHLDMKWFYDNLTRESATRALKLPRMVCNMETLGQLKLENMIFSPISWMIYLFCEALAPVRPFLTRQWKRVILTHLPSINFQKVFLHLTSWFFFYSKKWVPKPYRPSFTVFQIFVPTLSYFGPNQLLNTTNVCK